MLPVLFMAITILLSTIEGIWVYVGLYEIFNLNSSRSWYNTKVVSTTITNRIVNYELFDVVAAIF